MVERRELRTKNNIASAIGLYTDPKNQEFHITGDVNTISIIKSHIRQLNQQKNEEPKLKWMRIEPAVIGGVEFYQILRVAISGRNHRRIVTFVFFPDGYPKERPFIYFEDLINAKGEEVVFQHVNVFRFTRGKLCLEAIQKNYSASMTLSEILLALEKCIYDDNVKSPANGTLSSTKQQNEKEYHAILNAQAELLEWLEEREIPNDEEEEEY